MSSKAGKRLEKELFFDEHGITSGFPIHDSTMVESRICQNEVMIRTLSTEGEAYEIIFSKVSLVCLRNYTFSATRL